MEPFTAIGMSASVLSSIYETAVIIRDIIHSYNIASTVLRKIEIQCTTLEAAVKKVQRWKDSMVVHSSEENDKILESLQQALAMVQQSMDNLYADLERIKVKAGGMMNRLGTTSAGRFAKAKYVFNEDIMKGHLKEMRECVTLIHFILSVAQLETPTERVSRAYEVAEGVSTLQRARTGVRRKPSEQRTKQLSPAYAQFLDYLDSLENEVPAPSYEKDILSVEEVGNSADTPDAEVFFELGEKARIDSGTHVDTVGGASASNISRDDLSRQSTISDMTDLTSISASNTLITLSTGASDSYSTQPTSPASSMTTTVHRKPIGARSSSTNLSATSGAASPELDSAPFGISLGPDLSSKSSSFSFSADPDLPALPSRRDRSPLMYRDARQSPSPLCADDTGSSLSSPPPYSVTTGRPHHNTLPIIRKQPSTGFMDSPPPLPIRSHSSPTAATQYDVNAPDAEGFPLLVRAATDGEEGVILRLLQEGADVNALNRRTRRNALHEAVDSGHERIVDVLVRHGCRLDHVDHRSLNPLQSAVSAGRQNIAERLIRARHPVAAQADIQNSLLFLSAVVGNQKLFHQLVEQGASLDQKDERGRSVLELSVAGGNIDIVNSVMGRSELKTRPAEMQAAFFQAIECGNVDLVRMFMDRGIQLKKLKNEAHKPAKLAAISGSIPVLDLLIYQKCNLKEKDEDGWSPLHHAAYHGNNLACERLLEKGLSPKDTTKKRKETPLHVAVRARHPSTVHALLRAKNVPTNVKDQHDQFPIHVAARVGDPEIFKLLLAKDAGHLSAENAYGWKPIHIASAYGHMSIIEELVSRGADVDDRVGNTKYDPRKDTHAAVEAGAWREARWPYPGSRPLHLALEFEHTPIARKLLDLGAKLDAVDSAGWRPIHHAAWNGNAEMVERLLDAGAYVHAVTDQGHSPLQLRYRGFGEQIDPMQRMKVEELLQVRMHATKKLPMAQMNRLLSVKPRTVEEKERLAKAAILAVELQRKGTEMSG